MCIDFIGRRTPAGMPASGSSRQASSGAPRQGFETRTRHYDAAEQLDSPEEIAAHIEAALEDGDPRVIAHALRTLARARGMSNIARKTGLGRESFYKALSPDGNPTLATALKVVRALGLRLNAEPANGR